VSAITTATLPTLDYTPDFWDEAKATQWYRPQVETAFLEGAALRKSRRLTIASKLAASGLSNGIMLTDLQNGFRDNGDLPVNGTDQVVLRACIRILNGIVNDHYTLIIHSQDGHVPWHISFGTRWINEQGDPFDLRTNKAAVLSLENRAHGVFRATCFNPADGSPIDMGLIQSAFNIKDSVDYWDHLQATGQGPIWVFAMHCKIGTDEVSLHPLLAETLAFAEGARLIEPVPLFKGHIRDTDWFGPLEPCRPDPAHPQGGFQKTIVDLMSQVTGQVEFFGVAEDFCDFNMKKQVLARLKGTPYLDRLAFAVDGTAPIVPNAPHVIQQDQEARDAGVRFFYSADPFGN
jgi:nicotinamidase-related amidase